jgi:hypothetical protein
MAGGIVINGRFVARPGIYSNINYITIPGAPTQGTVLAVVGDFPFLEQNVPYVSTSQRDFEALAPQSLLLKKMSSIIYNPLLDANLTAAPAAVYLVSPRENTQAWVQVAGDSPAEGIIAKAKQWGTTGNSTSLKIVSNAARGGWDATVRNNGTQESIRIPAEETALLVDYNNPNEPDSLDVLAPIKGFGDWLTPLGGGSTAASAGNLSLALGGLAPGVDGTLRISFSRDIAPNYATGSLISVWEPAGPVSGKLTIKSSASAVLSAGTLSVLVTGIDADTGNPATDTLSFTVADVADEEAKETPTSFESVTKVEFLLTNGAASLTGGGMNVAGQCFADMNEAAGQKYVSDVIRVLQQYSDKGFVTSTQSSRVASIKLVDLDVKSATDFGEIVSSAPVALTANGWKIVTTINAASKLITLERDNAADPTGEVANLFKRLAGGTESGVLDAADWGDALDSLVWYNIDTVAAFYDATGTEAADDVVLAQFQAHITQMWSDGANERTLWLGAGSGENFVQLVQRAAVSNSERVNVVVDSAYIQQPDGSTELMRPYWYALMLAAADASLLNVETLTRARPRVLGVDRGDGSDTLLSQEDVNELIRAGLIISTTPPGGATRIEREVTTWTADENPARTEAICTRSVRASTKAMRAALDSLIRPGAGVLVLADVQSQVSTELERQARSVSPLITNYDPRSIRIVESADRYEVGYIITVRINKNFITLNVGVTVPSGTI